MENSTKLQKKYFYRLDSNPSGHLGSGFYLYFPVFRHLRMYYFQHPGFKQRLHQTSSEKKISAQHKAVAAAARQKGARRGDDALTLTGSAEGLI